MINVYAEEISFIKKFEIKNYYDNNILKLSENTLDEFEQGSNPEKFKLKSADDLVTSLKLDLGIKHFFAMGHTQINKIVINYNKYWNNGFKDDGYIRFSLHQYLNRKINFQLNYYYYPEIYSNNYRSVLDDEYHSYTYSKNIYNAAVNWKVFKKLEIRYRFEYGQYYFNKFFTEYDSKSIESKVDLYFKLTGNLYSTLSYAFKISDADAGDAYDDVSGSFQYKDASYKANLFYIQFIIPRLLTIDKGSLKLRLRASFEGYFPSLVEHYFFL